jgi:transcriptional regulator with XRE-family HTH domain
MGRPEEPLDRDGSPVKEFAFWLRDLRRRSGLTYERLASRAHYAISTVQEAAAGRRLPTLRVTLAYVAACDGDQTAWREYWTRISRKLDATAPDGASRSVRPPWLDGAPVPVAAQDLPRPAARGAENWFTASFTALVRADVEPAARQLLRERDRAAKAAARR